MTEQYVCQQLKTLPDIGVYYYTNDRGTSEVDFVIDWKGNVFPIEVKAEENLKAKSLKTFCEKYNPPRAIRTSMSDYREQDWMINIPLYAIAELLE